MNRQLAWLDTIEVASPCTASWEEMTGDDRSRFCRHCQLHIYNLSEMTREEAEQFVQTREGRTCVRFHRRSDGTLLSRDCPLGLRAVKRQLYRAVAAVAGIGMALLTGTLFGSRLSRFLPEGFQPPSQAMSEWIEPGSTRPAMVMGEIFCPLPTPGPTR